MAGGAVHKGAPWRGWTWPSPPLGAVRSLSSVALAFALGEAGSSGGGRWPAFTATRVRSATTASSRMAADALGRDRGVSQRVAPGPLVMLTRPATEPFCMSRRRRHPRVGSCPPPPPPACPAAICGWDGLSPPPRAPDAPCTTVLSVGGWPPAVARRADRQQRRARRLVVPLAARGSAPLAVRGGRGGGRGEASPRAASSSPGRPSA